MAKVYEVDKTSGGVVTRTLSYYGVAGAMRISGTLYYVLGDQLSSASVVTDNSGAVVGEQRYYPYGETRVPSGNMQTERLYTGQRQMASLGNIYDYGARFYSPLLGRFLSADTIVPSVGNPQALNRYTYVLNNPLLYIDPSGCASCVGSNWDDGPQCFGKSTADTLMRYGVQTYGQWDLNHLGALLDAVHAVGDKYSKTVGGSAASAFRKVYQTDVRPVGFLWGKSPDIYSGFYEQFGMTGGGVTIGNTVTASGSKIQLIAFLSMAGDSFASTDSAMSILRSTNNIVHELGHLFGVNYQGGLPYTEFGKALSDPLLKRDNPQSGQFYGFASGYNHFTWQQSYVQADTKEEIFADMFLGWTFNTWYAGTDQDNLNRAATRSGWMTTNMAIWLSAAR